MRLASVSCSNYPAGYFNVYRCLANRDDLDAVLHLGDYIYEFANGVYGDGSGSGRVPMPAGEAVTLADYRLRYATYRSDVDLQAAHRPHPFIAVWDDHEVINDWWRDGAPAAPARRRRRGPRASPPALQAYREWMPVREAAGGTPALSQLPLRPAWPICIMLDTRSFRDRQARTTRRGGAGRSGAHAAWARRRRSGCSPGCSARSARAPGGASSASRRCSRRWRPRACRRRTPTCGTAIRRRAPACSTAIEKSKLSNVAILTGDIHSSWALDVPRSPFKGYTPGTGEGSLAVELVTPAISSPPLFASASLRDSTALLQLFTPHLKFLDGEQPRLRAARRHRGTAAVGVVPRARRGRAFARRDARGRVRLRGRVARGSPKR